MIIVSFQLPYHNANMKKGLNASFQEWTEKNITLC